MNEFSNSMYFASLSTKVLPIVRINEVNISGLNKLKTMTWKEEKSQVANAR